MKKLLTLVLTLALCLPMFMMTSVEAKAADLCYHEGCNNVAAEDAGGICTECFEAIENNPAQPGLFEKYDESADGHRQYTLWGCGHKVYESDYEYHRYENEKPNECYDCGFETDCNHNTFSYRYRSISDPGKHFRYPFCTECWSHIYYKGIEEPHNNCPCGKSVSGNSTPAPTPAPAPSAPSADEIMQMEIEEVAQAAEAVVKAEVEMPVTDFVSAEAVSALPAEVKDTTGDAAVYNLSKITTTRGFVAAVTKMVETNKASAQQSKAVTFYSSTPIAFNTSSLTALSDAATEFVYMFEYEGHLYKVTIPAGAKVDLAGQRFAGPLYIGAQLGTSELVK